MRPLGAVEVLTAAFVVVVTLETHVVVLEALTEEAMEEATGKLNTDGSNTYHYPYPYYRYYYPYYYPYRYPYFYLRCYPFYRPWW